ncbi:uncharacterized protein ColSpa_06551 [Colletotrichum spaethianum]|uniref:Uncharacterized protein n=1 Tax=Colletotrichum spaethianum TaxID=700344 RepID=A0AA37P168_9PEZI|nr:uncharacterized protein ColSpa_06551 [Colletotrichum spaethianum]GKT46370.1 hypothetical protein ColSpa_06551 [Colletotrichum spaethianum]
MSAATTRIAAKSFAAPQQRVAFSTTRPGAAAAGPTPGKNNVSNNKSGESPIEIPVFNLRHITSSPRARFWLITGFCVVGSVEMYGWYNFGPKIFGWEEGRKGGENA